MNILILLSTLICSAHAEAKKQIDPKKFINRSVQELKNQVMVKELKIDSPDLAVGSKVEALKADDGIIVLTCKEDETKGCLIKDLAIVASTPTMENSVYFSKCSNLPNHLALIVKSIPKQGVRIPIYRTWNLGINSLSISAVATENLTCDFSNF